MAPCTRRARARPPPTMPPPPSPSPPRPPYSLHVQLKDALKAMQDKESKAMDDEARVQAKKDLLNKKIKAVDEAIAATREAEDAIAARGMTAALPLKRKALKIQSQLTASEAEWDRAMEAENEAREREEKERNEREAREAAKLAEKGKAKAEKERAEKAEREKRLQEKLIAALSAGGESEEEKEKRLLKEGSSKFAAMLASKKAAKADAATGE